MEFVSNPVFETPKVLTHISGYVVIESDDGPIGDITTWMPLMKQIAAKYSQWNDPHLVVGCSCINTATTGTSQKMTAVNLKDLRARGWEIMSHGRHHAGHGKHKILTAVAAGATSVNVERAGMLSAYGVTGYEYLIEEGDKHEIVRVSSLGAGGAYDNRYITLVNPLTNAYTTAATIRITLESLALELQGCVNDLATWGVKATNHAYPYHAGVTHTMNPEAVAYVSTLFRSARGLTSLFYNDPENLDLFRMEAFGVGDVTTNEEIDQYLDLCAANGYAIIFYGHGERTELRLQQLSRIIEGSISRGIKITTRERLLTELGIA